MEAPTCSPSRSANGDLPLMTLSPVRAPAIIPRKAAATPGSRTTVRRWLYLDAEGVPVLDDGAEPLHLLREGEVVGESNLESLLNPIEAALLDGERQRLLPLVDELRENAEHAWHRSITREMAQLAEADWTAHREGRLPDPRWVRMKNGLITKLQDELARRLAELEQIRDQLEGCLDLRVAIRIE